jgi:hypothetical protein
MRTHINYPSDTIFRRQKELNPLNYYILPGLALRREKIQSV